MLEKRRIFNYKKVISNWSLPADTSLFCRLHLQGATDGLQD